MANFKKIWILIADGSRAKIFEKTKHDYLSIPGSEMTGNRMLDAEALSDKPGRTYSSHANIRHSYEPKTSWHEHQKHDFAKQMSHYINKAHEKKEFEHLIIIAPSKVLGDLRNFLDKNVLSKIYSEIHKDITKLTDVQIKDFLSNEFDE